MVASPLAFLAAAKLDAPPCLSLSCSMKAKLASSSSSDRFSLVVIVA